MKTVGLSRFLHVKFRDSSLGAPLCSVVWTFFFTRLSRSVMRYWYKQKWKKHRSQRVNLILTDGLSPEIYGPAEPLTSGRAEQLRSPQRSTGLPLKMRCSMYSERPLPKGFLSFPMEWEVESVEGLGGVRGHG